MASDWCSEYYAASLYFKMNSDIDCPSSSRPRVLVLLASYNGRESLHEQLQSILQQRGVDVTIFVADDCSRDGTVDFLADIAKVEPRLSFVRWDTGSGSAGENFRRLFIKADVAGFDLVALADQDDIWLPEKLHRAAEALSVSGADGYSGAVEAFWENGRRRILRQSNDVTQADFLFEGAGQGCTFVVPVENFLKIQSFCRQHAQLVSKMHYHDWLIYLLIRSWGGKWYFDSNVTMQYRQHANNEIGSRGGWSGLKYRISKVRNGWYREQILRALTITSIAADMSSKVSSFAKIFNNRDSFLRRFRMSLFLLAHGRRKFSERLLLVSFSIAGWI